jgi:hypothetical protein
VAQVEDPPGYLGPECLFEQLTALITQAALPIIQSRSLPRDGLRFVIEHAAEDEKHATFIKHLILDVVTRYPDRATAMLRRLPCRLTVSRHPCLRRFELAMKSYSRYQARVKYSFGMMSDVI